MLWDLTPLRAWSPYPKDGTSDTGRGIVLTWAPGRSETAYDVYFGQDADAIDGATVESPGIYRGRQKTGSTAYDPGSLEWGKTYYWRIDEVNEADPNSPWKGSVWSFTTADYIVVSAVDDFESYTDGDGSRVYQTWIDGFGPDDNTPGNGTGSMVGNNMPPYAEQLIVHAGWQSMPIDYNNVKKPWCSEARRTWATPQDWTIGGADTVTLYFRGDPNNSRDRLYVAIEDSAGRMAVIVHPDPAAVLATEWQKWDIALTDVRAAGVDVAAVKKMVIGVGDRQSPRPGGTGRIYIDDIRLTKRMP